MINIGRSYLKQINNNGGRVLLLFLLFIIGLLTFYSKGLAGYAIICLIPAIIVTLFLASKNKMITFWVLFFLNYTIMGIGRYINIPIPVTLLIQSFEFLLLFNLIIEKNNDHLKYLSNTLFFMLIIWIIYLFIQIFNNTCDLPFYIDQWFLKVNLFGLQILFACIIVALMVNKPQEIIKFLRFWAVLAIIACYWAWRQKTFGFDSWEKIWLASGGARTHIIGGAIRYFSFFSEAANFGCHMGGAAVAFYIISITTKLKKDKILFLIAGLMCTYGMFTSGTRTAIFCFFAAIFLYIFLSKSIRIAIPVITLTIICGILLAFTQVGNSNPMIRRMRTAFDPNDASKGVREINKLALKKYMQDAHFGLGISMDPFKVPANNKYKIVTQTASDSTYVYLWEYTGIVGETLFALVNILSLLAGCRIVLFKLRSDSLKGVGASFCCAFAAINIGGYANNILTQYPNLIVMYGGMAIVFILPLIETDWEKYEAEKLAQQERKKQLQLEKKRASRV